MTKKADKLIEKWKRSEIGHSTPLNDVKLVLKKYGFQVKDKKEIIVSHEKLINHPDTSSEGEFTIARVKGRFVKKPYIKVIVKYIRYLEGEVYGK